MGRVLNNLSHLVGGDHSHGEKNAGDAHSLPFDMDAMKEQMEMIQREEEEIEEEEAAAPGPESHDAEAKEEESSPDKVSNEKDAVALASNEVSIVEAEAGALSSSGKEDAAAPLLRDKGLERMGLQVMVTGGRAKSIGRER